MQRLKRALQTSMLAFRGKEAQKKQSANSMQRANTIRTEMLKSLGGEGCNRYGQLCHRIDWAPDCEALWYVRCELMMALGELRGETEAHQCMAAITALFKGGENTVKPLVHRGTPRTRVS